MIAIFPDRKSEVLAMLRIAGAETSEARVALVAACRHALTGLACAIGVLVLAMFYPGSFWDWLPLRLALATASGWLVGRWWMFRQAYQRHFNRFLEVTKLYISVSGEQHLNEWRAQTLGDAEGDSSP